VLKSKSIYDKIKKSLKRQYDGLNPAYLKRKIARLLDKLLKLNRLRQKAGKEMIVNEASYVYITE